MEKSLGCAMLAQTAFGYVKLCMVGCTHLTFGRATLHFESLDEFEGFAETAFDEARRRGRFDRLRFSYNWATVSLDCYDAGAFLNLLREAMEAISWFLGDMTLTEEDERAMLRDRHRFRETP